MTSGTGGPSIWANPSGRLPAYGTIRSAVPLMAMTDMGAGLGQSPSMVAATGPMAASRSVSQASR